MEGEQLENKAGGRTLDVPKSGSRRRHQKRTSQKTKSIRCHELDSVLGLVCAKHHARCASCIISDHQSHRYKRGSRH